MLGSAATAGVFGEANEHWLVLNFYTYRPLFGAKTFCRVRNRATGNQSGLDAHRRNDFDQRKNGLIRCLSTQIRPRLCLLSRVVSGGTRRCANALPVRSTTSKLKNRHPRSAVNMDHLGRQGDSPSLARDVNDCFKTVGPRRRNRPSLGAAKASKVAVVPRAPQRKTSFCIALRS